MKERTAEHLLALQSALSDFTDYAFHEGDVRKVMTEATRVCASSLDVPFCKILQFRTEYSDFEVIAGYGWGSNFVGTILSPVTHETPDGRAYLTRTSVCSENLLSGTEGFVLTKPYTDYVVLSSANVVIPAEKINSPFGILEVDSCETRQFHKFEIVFMRGIANLLARNIVSSRIVRSLQTALIEREDLIIQKEVLLQELHHRVRNNLQLVYGLLLDSARLPVEIPPEAIARRVLTLAQVYDHMSFAHSGPNKIEFGSYIQALCNNLRKLLSERGVNMHCQTEPMNLHLEAATALGLAVNELITIGAAHTKASDTISVRLTRNGSEAMLIVEDTGQPHVDQESKRSGVGLVRRLTQQISAKLTISVDRGRQASIIFRLIDVPHNSKVRD